MLLAPLFMFERLSLRSEDFSEVIQTERQMADKSLSGRLMFAVIMSGISLIWLPVWASALYLGAALAWELKVRPHFTARLIAKFGPDRTRLPGVYRAIVFCIASFYALLPLTGLLSHVLIGWYAAIIAFGWATIVGVTYFSNDRWLFASATLPSFLVANLGTLLWHVHLNIAVAVLMLHALFVLGALQSALHRAELVESIAKQRSARSKAENDNLEKSRFIANVSHELRTPLNAIIGYSEMLSEAAEDAARLQDKADLDKVLGASRTLLSLVNELLDISKLEAGKLTLDISGFDAHEIVDAAIARARGLAAAEGAGAELSLNVDARLGHGVGDEYRFGQCVSNLLSNALRAAGSERVTLSAKRENAGGRDWFVVDVHHDGPGLSAEALEALFDPFARNIEPTTQAAGSLGLSITRRVARMLGGDVSATSAPGAGATFTLRTPAMVGVAVLPHAA